MFHPLRVFLYELLANSNYNYVHSWLVTRAMQLAVLKIISLKSYYGCRLTYLEFLHFPLISLQYESSFLYHNNIAKPLYGSAYKSFSSRVGN